MEKRNTWTLFMCMWGGGTTTLEKVQRFLKKFEPELSYNPAILPGGIYPKLVKSGSWRDTCILTFTGTTHKSQEVEKTQNFHQ